MTVPAAEHQSGGWVLSSIAPDFELLDVWALPVEGAADDADRALRLLATFDPVGSGPLLVRALFAVRLLLGRLLRWDGPTERTIPGSAGTSLAERVPVELRGSADDVPVAEPMRQAAGGFRPLYRTPVEWAGEISNATVHGVLQLVWAPLPEQPGRHQARMAVYVRPRGPLGRLYLALIEPFRRYVVYPAMLRDLGRAWAESQGTRP